MTSPTGAGEHGEEEPPDLQASDVQASGRQASSVGEDDLTPPSGVPVATGGPRDPAHRRRVRRIVLAVLLGVVVVAAVVVALLAFLVGPRFARYDVLDRAAVERGVGEVLTRDWHRQATGVSCPADQRVRPDTSFVCTATVDGRPQQVPVDVLDREGSYQVGQPR